LTHMFDEMAWFFDNFVGDSKPTASQAMKPDPGDGSAAAVTDAAKKAAVASAGQALLNEAGARRGGKLLGTTGGVLLAGTAWFIFQCIGAHNNWHHLCLLDVSVCL
jgi:hypothetical protein